LLPGENPERGHAGRNKRQKTKGTGTDATASKRFGPGRGGDIRNAVLREKIG